MPQVQLSIDYLGREAAPNAELLFEFKFPKLSYEATIDAGSDAPAVRRSVRGHELISMPSSARARKGRLMIPDVFIVEPGRSLRAFQRYARAAASLDELSLSVDYVAMTERRTPLTSGSWRMVPVLRGADPRGERAEFVAALLPEGREDVVLFNHDQCQRLLGDLGVGREHGAELMWMIARSASLDESGSLDFDQRVDEGVERQIIAKLEEWHLDRAEERWTRTRTRLSALVDVQLRVPELPVLRIAGTFVCRGADGAIADFDASRYRMSAEYSLGKGTDATEPEILKVDWSRATRGDAGVQFDLRDDAETLLADVASPVRISVTGFDGSPLYDRSVPKESPDLRDLTVIVRVIAPVTLSRPPGQPDSAKRLRGKVVSLAKNQRLGGLGVLIRARSEGDENWRIVAATTTDGSGAFSMPYPYGACVAARAVVSTAEEQPVDIPIVQRNDPDVCIADDFLYLLIGDRESSPTPPVGSEDGDCGCRVEKTTRLPDQADLVGSGEYTQDIGGGCVNLTTPNRTLSEFRYQAIVRTSDPDVANYVLSRKETTLENVDANQAVVIANAAVRLRDEALNAGLVMKETQAVGGGSVVLSVNLEAVTSAAARADMLASSLQLGGATMSTLRAGETHLDAIVAVLEGIGPDLRNSSSTKLLATAQAMKPLFAGVYDLLGASARFDLAGGQAKIQRMPVDLLNPIAWQDSPSDRKALSFFQAVTVATGHVLHYRSAFKADGYSLGELIYSLPLAPGQKKEIVVLDATHTLRGEETQAQSQGERLAASLVNEREITTQLGGNISESIRGRSTASTSGISAGLGVGAVVGPVGGLLGVAGGVSNAASEASQDSGRTVSQFFSERLRNAISQNAESYRQLNGTVVSTVQEGQRYTVTTEVVANHNHCHALTMMYFEVLRHYAVFQELVGVEECVFVPLLLTHFTGDNIFKWRDVLADSLLPLSSNTYLPEMPRMASGNAHPLLRAFDAVERIRTNYANVDFPVSTYAAGTIRNVWGEIDLRVHLPRPRTRYDRILSLPIVSETSVAGGAATGVLGGAAGAVGGALIGAVIGSIVPGIGTLIGAAIGGAFGGSAGSQIATDAATTTALVRKQVFDQFMQLDANYQTVPPSQCIRVTRFEPTPITIGPLTLTVSGSDFFDGDIVDQNLWMAYAGILGYSSVYKMLDFYFKGRLIAEWDEIFNNDIAPVILQRIADNIRIDPISADTTAHSRYRGGERSIRVTFRGSASTRRDALPASLRMTCALASAAALKDSATLVVENVRIRYETPHYSGQLFGGYVGDDLLDGTDLPIPVSSDEKRNPRKEDAFLASKLIEHLNSHLEHYNRALWANLDVDRRYMLLDGFSVQVYDRAGQPAAFRSLASVVKNNLIAVAGNSLVLPVAAGFRVNGSHVIAVDEGGGNLASALFDHYRPLTPIEPYRISVPSRGVFAEAVQGACNACEKIETDRLQDWNRFPIGDEPPSINAVNVPTPTVTDWRAAFKDFASPIVNVQNAPAAPAPGAGLVGLAELLGKSGAFNDVTGLDANQQNAIRTYLSNQENARAFAEMAKEMATQQHNTENSGRIMDSIAAAKQSGDLNTEDAGKLVKDHLQQQIDGGEEKKAEREMKRQSTPSLLTQAAVDAASLGKTVKARVAVGDGGVESIDIGDTQRGREVSGMPDVVEAVANVAGTVFGIARAVTGDALVGDPSGDIEISAAVVEHLGTLANCGNGPCVNVSSTYFARAMKAKGVPLTTLSTDGGPVQMPVVASANGSPVSARALLILWFSNSTDATWTRLPRACRGAGAPGALLYADLVSGRAIINSETGWPVGMVPGALLQLWSSKAEYEALRDNGEVPGLGHSCVFVGYDAGDNSRIVVADQMDLAHSIKYPYLGLKFVMAANLSKGKIVSFV